MAETRRYGLTPQLDIQQILLEAQHRWLRPAEICEILRNYQKFHIAPEPPNQPPSGSLFLFDRKILRYFRKDGHNWRKKKDGKTVKEAHERLKAGSVDVLHCYYAHGEENGNFQRRSYWMLEEDFMHIVLVHYREVQDKKETYGRTRDVEEIPHGVFGDSPSSSNSAVNYTQIPSPATDSDSRNSVQASEYEDTEPDNYQASSRYHPFTELRQFNGKSVMVDSNSQDAYFPVLPQTVQGDYQRASTSEINIYSVAQEDITKIFDESGRQLTFNGTRTQIDLPSWDAVLEQCTVGLPDASFPLSVSSVLPFNMGTVQNNETFVLDEAFASGYSSIQTDAQGESAWQELSESEASNLHTSDMGVKSAPANEGNIKYASLLKQLSLDFPSTEGDKGLQKYDSFSKWMSKELGEVDDSYLKPSSGIYWDVVGSESMVDDNCLSPQENLDTYMLSPSLSKDQLFSISNFLPSWAWAGLEIMVFVTGRFLMNKDGIHKRNWSCMFGQVEVPAAVVADGVLRCLAPAHKSGAVPFYITCSNRLACSEVREFEFRDNQEQTLDCFEFYTGSAHEMLLYTRLDKLLSGRPPRHLDMISDFFPEKAHVCKKISSLLMGTNDELSLKLKKATDKEFIANKPNDQLLQRLLKEKLHAWLLEKVLEDGKGPNVQDEEGQGVIHLASALGYDWAIAPTIAAGVKINFRDLRGWTALHWAASCGRESTIVALLSLGADPGALTDPTPDFPSGRTPADLASRNGHKGIAGFLAETSLTAHLSNLKIKEAGGSGAPGTSSTRAVENAEVRSTVQLPDGDVQSHLSLKDSLSAVRNAAQAAARIYQVYRVHSFHRKKVVEYGNDKFGMSDERALSLISVKSNKTGQHDEPAHAAAVRIQNKFRGWKGRKEFLIIRQRIVKIQAHIRGYQVRKHFRKIVWSVGIVEKAILRWRRKGNGLRGFKSEGLIEGTAMQIQTAKEDDYDFLREGRKQTEARLERALARVKSMAQYPEARDQYRRLLTGVEEFQESKLVLERILNDTEEETDVHMMFDIEELLGDDLPTPTA